MPRGHAGRAGPEQVLAGDSYAEAGGGRAFMRGRALAGHLREAGRWPGIYIAEIRGRSPIARAWRLVVAHIDRAAHYRGFMNSRPGTREAAAALAGGRAGRGSGAGTRTRSFRTTAGCGASGQPDHPARRPPGWVSSSCRWPACRTACSCDYGQRRAVTWTGAFHGRAGIAGRPACGTAGGS